LTQLPGQEFHYQLRYLRPSDIKQILDMVRPMLSPATGIVNFEPKTNTVVVIDAAHRIEQIRGFLHGIDQAKGQIVVETKILRINSTAAEKAGVNWTSSLGDGVPLSVSRDLNSVFGLPSSPASSLPFAEGTNLVLSPVQLDAVLTALNSGNFAHQISNPTLITEDNEQATISIIDRVPIITTTTTANTSGGNPTVTEDVRYKISPDDKTIDQDADKQREIGISMVVTPTLLPDGTVRMKLRPRSAQIVDEVISVATGNKYPRVTESMVESFARVPNGYSLVVGGFYGEAKLDRNTKVPLLGDIPVINFFFKSKDMRKEQTSLVFVVTPRSYDPTSGCATNRAGEMVQQGTELEPNWADPANPGPGHEPNLRRSIRGARPQQAPYYPLPGESTAPSPPPAPSKYPFARSKR
jgi:type II secretory pathway component GspD/PulD (secretin)